MLLRLIIAALALAALPLSGALVASQTVRETTPARAERPVPKPQARPHGRRVEVAPAAVDVEDGDTVTILWGGGDAEIVRILGIDAPETRNPAHDLPFSQAFGPEARAFAQGAFAAATRVELLRASTLDPYGRTLGYLFVNGQNYSVLIIRARLAEESVSRYGDNGLPVEAAAVTAAAKVAGPVPFEPPGVYRGRMREVSKWLRERGDPDMVSGERD